MNAYELADKLETDKWDEATIVRSINDGIKMLRQQADRIAELEKALQDGIKTFGELQFQLAKDKFEKQSEPVAWMYQNSSGEMKMLGNTRLEEWVTKFGCKEIPLYTTPQTKPLSDEEILEICDLGEWHKDEFAIKFARAIEAKVRGQ